LDSAEENVRIVTDAYQQLLARMPDQSGLTTFVASLANGMTPGQLDSELVASGEFVDRASQTVLSRALDSLNSSTHGSLRLKADAGSGQTVNEGTAVTFAGGTSGGTAPFNYNWGFGDGSTSVSGTLTPTHTYITYGAYTATLTVTDSRGQTVQSSTVITVN